MYIELYRVAQGGGIKELANKNQPEKIMIQKIFFGTRKKIHLVKQFVVISFLLISCLFLHPSMFAQIQLNTMKELDKLNDSVKGITIHQEISFKASPQRLYEVMLNSKEFSECTKKTFDNFTAMSANIDSAEEEHFLYSMGILSAEF